METNVLQSVQTAPPPVVVGSVPTVTPTPAPEPWKYQGERLYFEPAEIQKAAETATAISQQVDETTKRPITVLTYQGDAWPTGAGIAILPLARNEDFNVTSSGGKVEKVTRRVMHAVVVWPWFTSEAVMTHKDGGDYIRSVIQDDQAARILNPLRKQRWEKGEFDLSGCPKALSDHIEGMAADRGTVKAYMEAAKELLPHLKKMHAIFAQMTPQFLRQLLSSAALARSFSAKLEEKGFFTGLIDKLEAITKKAGGNLDIYIQWRVTRSEAAAASVDDLDLAQLGV